MVESSFWPLKQNAKMWYVCLFTCHTFTSMNLNVLFTKGVCVHLSKANILLNVEPKSHQKFLKMGVTGFCENATSNFSLIPILVKHCCQPKTYFKTIFPYQCSAEGWFISKDDYLKTDQP